MANEQLIQQVRQAADELNAPERAEFARDLARAVYDSEKFTGEGGEGLDGRDSAARRALGKVVDAAEEAVRVVR